MANNLCCDVCQPVCPYTELTVTSVSVEARKRTVRKRALPTDMQHFLEAKLLVERDALIARHPALKMFPKSVICPLSVVRELCSKSRSINNIDDIRSLPCIRPEFHLPFFNVIVECLSNAPHPKRACVRQQS